MISYTRKSIWPVPIQRYIKLSTESCQWIYCYITQLATYLYFNPLRCDQLVADRVRRIYIFSHFDIPAKPRCNLLTLNPTLFKERFNTSLIRLEDLRRLLNRNDINDISSSDASQEPYSCAEPVVLRSVRELTVTSGDRNKSFDVLSEFVELLWKEHHVGESLRKLEVAATTFGVVMLLNPTIRYLNRPSTDGGIDDKNAGVLSFRNLRPCTITHLSVHFIPEFMAYSISYRVNKHLVQLLELLALSLTSLSLIYSPNIRVTVSGPHQHDFSKVLEALPYLPSLKEIMLQAPFAPQMMENPGALTECLRAYEGQLEQLTIRPVSAFDTKPETEDFSDSDLEPKDVRFGGIVSNWLTKGDGLHYRGFPSLTFSMLHSLEIYTRHCLTVTLPLQQVTPSLRSLTLGHDDRIDQKKIEGIIQGLPTMPDGYCRLETLRLRCFRLSLSLLDLLHARLPRLKELEVVCKRIVSVTQKYV